MMGVLLDTCILIDYLRGRPDAIGFVEALDGPPVVSALTVAELFAGVRDGRERAELDRLTAACRVVPLDANLATEGGLLFRRFRASHGIDLIDALIAASALSVEAPLATLNRKHFPMLRQLIVPYS